MFTRGGMIMNTVLSACEGFPDTKFHPGDVLLRAGESTRRLYILVEGEVEVLKGDFPVATLSEPGTKFGEKPGDYRIGQIWSQRSSTRCFNRGSSTGKRFSAI